jgi:hypothetical protein
MVSGGNTLIVAQRKTGKTTLMLNLARSLLTGEDALGRFEVHPVAEGRTVAVLNYEMGAKQLARWAHGLAIPHDRLWIVNLRGRRNPLMHEQDRLALATELREHRAEVLLVDTFSRAFTGTDQNDNGQVSQFLSVLDRFAHGDVGAADLILTVHMGWGPERSRGASALEDWPDSIINLVKDDDDGKRYLSAFGRDVDVAEDEITHNGVTGALTASGNGSRTKAKKQAKATTALPFMTAWVAQNPGTTQNAIYDHLRETTWKGSKDDITEASKMGVEQGLWKVVEGANRSREHWIIPVVPGGPG